MIRHTLLASAALLWAAPALAQHEGHQMPPSMPMEDHSQHELPPSTPMEDHSQHRMPAEASPPGHMDPAAHAMSAALGSYPMNREASGTAWQPDVSPHGGLHAMAGDWHLMGHLQLNAVYDRQQGPRGGEKAFVSGMAMGMARRPLGTGTLQLRAMVSPDALMGRRGYPLLLTAGETADGVTPLVDRQHPHDLIGELSASYSVPLGDGASAFVYVGLPGEPAFGPPAYFHRLSIMDSPEAPISHHWLDSTHVSFGVVTAGLVLDRVKIEASRFNAREPDQHRFDIETGPLDSTAVRLSWNPTDNLSLQASWADMKGPEQLLPDEDQTRWSASALYTEALGEHGYWSVTAAWGRRSSDHRDLDAFLLEGTLKFDERWTLFARAERTENDELVQTGGHHGPAFKVAKISIGGVRDFAVAPHLKIGAGALYSFGFVPAGLEPSYGGDPDGAMVFLRLKVD